MKHRRAWVILAICCLCLGAMLAGAGFAMGGTLHDTLGVHFGNDEFGIGFFGKGKSTHQTETTILEPYQRVTMDISLGDIKIKEGKEYALHVKNAPSSEYDVSQTQEEVHISSHLKHSSFNFNLGDLDYEYVLEVPKGTQLEFVQINSNMGDVKLNDILCTTIVIDQKMGDIKLYQTISDKTDLTQKMGEIEYKGSHPGSMELHNAMGDIDVEIHDDIQLYRFELSTSMGDIKTNHRRVEGFSGEIEEGPSDAPYVIRGDNRMGDIEVVVR